MLKDFVEVRPIGGYRLYLRFEDGVNGELDISGVVAFEGIFSEISDPEVFTKVRVDEDLGTICWPNGANLDPDVLYSRLKPGSGR